MLLALTAVTSLQTLGVILVVAMLVIPGRRASWSPGGSPPC
ncbi:metal ABC transporter permease [Nesterenkonia pannonica]|nr:metal ABC transporter permease [Nesterenkonia pannonica]